MMLLLREKAPTQTHGIDVIISKSVAEYISAMKEAGKASSEWIEWATKKADWLDPTIRAEDPFFGVRQHEQSEEYKKLKKKGYWY